MSSLHNLSADSFNEAHEYCRRRPYQYFAATSRHAIASATKATFIGAIATDLE